MITATVRYKLPPHIDYAACREHFHKIAPGFREVKGLISKHFICNESGWAGGVYQWERIEDANAFYTGPWLDDIVQRYGMKPQIEFYRHFASAIRDMLTFSLRKGALGVSVGGSFVARESKPGDLDALDQLNAAQMHHSLLPRTNPDAVL